MVVHVKRHPVRYPKKWRLVVDVTGGADKTSAAYLLVLIMITTFNVSCSRLLVLLTVRVWSQTRTRSVYLRHQAQLPKQQLTDNVLFFMHRLSWYFLNGLLFKVKISEQWMMENVDVTDILSSDLSSLTHVLYITFSVLATVSMSMLAHSGRTCLSWDF